MEEFKKFLLEGNPYAINILLNIIDSEIEKSNPNEEYYQNLKDLANKIMRINTERI